MRIQVTREVSIPDRLKLERFRRTPDLGPRLLFFSGGTATKGLSQELIHYTHNSIHIITPFDSGGSSATIRKAFRMPAVGDIRNRLMALADQSIKGNPEIFDLFAYRLSKTATQEELREELRCMAAGRHRLVRPTPDPMRKIIRNHLHQFIELMPGDFDLRGASIGNLVLTAGYLTNRRQLDPVIYLFSKLVQVCGIVRPVVNKDLHLAARLEDGSIVHGQHSLTGKETDPIGSPVKEVWLTKSLNDPEPVRADIRNKMREHIADAELICFPIGSFYSSIIANLLPDGVGEAVAANPCPKIFIPNTVHDPEAPNISVEKQVAELGKYLIRSGADSGTRTLDYVLVDMKRGSYPGGLNPDAVRSLGVEVLDCRLVRDGSGGLIDAALLSEVLLSLT